MALITKTTTFSAGTTARSGEVNTNFDTIYNEFNGSIDNANIKAAASIATSKLNLSAGLDYTVTTVIGLDLENDGTGNAIYVNQDGNGIGVNIENAGTTYRLQLDQNGSGTALNIDSEAFAAPVMILNNNGTHDGIDLIQAKVQAGTQYALKVTSNVAQTSAPLVYFRQDSTSADQSVLDIVSDGAGYAIQIAQNGDQDGVFIDCNAPEAAAIEIDQDSSSASLQYGIKIVIDNSTDSTAVCALQFSNSVGEFIAEVPHDTTTCPATATGRIKIRDGSGNVHYIHYVDDA